MGFLLPERAEATSLRALAVAELVRASDLVVEARAVEHRSEWANVGGRKRIVTLTRVLHDDAWVTRSSSIGESLVVTWGGRVGDLAQKVHGEPELTDNSACVLFLGAERDSRRRVVGMAQGHWLIRGTGDARSLAPSPALPPLMKPSGAHRSALVEFEPLTLAGAKRLVQERFAEEQER